MRVTPTRCELHMRAKAIGAKLLEKQLTRQANDTKTTKREMAMVSIIPLLPAAIKIRKQRAPTHSMKPAPLSYDLQNAGERRQRKPSQRTLRHCQIRLARDSRTSPKSNFQETKTQNPEPEFNRNQGAPNQVNQHPGLGLWQFRKSQ